jgi:hypothetical protein
VSPEYNLAESACMTPNVENDTQRHSESVGLQVHGVINSDEDSYCNCPKYSLFMREVNLSSALMCTENTVVLLIARERRQLILPGETKLYRAHAIATRQSQNPLCSKPSNRVCVY